MRSQKRQQMLDSNSKSIGSYQVIFFIQVVVVCPTRYTRYLAKNTGSRTSISSTYIVKSTKMQKEQTLANGFAPLKNDITKILKR